MQQKTVLVLALALGVSTLTHGAPGFAFNEDPTEDDPGLPLILSAEDPDNSDANDDTQASPTTDEGTKDGEEEVETLPAPAVVSDSDRANSDDVPLILPPVEEGEVAEGTRSDHELTEDEMRALSTQPLFKEFATTIEEVAPIPEEIDVEGLNVPGAQYVTSNLVIEGEEDLAPVSLEDATRQLDEALEIAKVDLNALSLSPQNRRSLEQLDAEIKRLCPIWIDAELNRGVIGRRELNWRQPNATLYTTNDPKPLEVKGSDWTMAPDNPFFFQVTSSLTGQTYYTKAGDFEQIDSTNLLSPALVRDDCNYLLSIEPSPIVPTGRSERIRILKNGQIQGVNSTGKIVTDVKLGTVALFMFDNPARLNSDDGVFFVPTPQSGEPKPTQLLAGTKIGVTQNKVLASNGQPAEIFARIVTLCKSKKRLVEILSQPTL